MFDFLLLFFASLKPQRSENTKIRNVNCSEMTAVRERQTDRQHFFLAAENQASPRILGIGNGQRSVSVSFA